MSLMPYWLRHLRCTGHLALHGPVTKILRDHHSVLPRDPINWNPIKVRQVSAPIEKNFHLGIVGVYPDSDVKVDRKKIELHLEIQNLSPEQIVVKTIGKEIIIKVKSEVRQDDGWTKNPFERRFLLPEGFPAEKVKCCFDRGKLKLIAFRTEPLDEKTIPIQEKSENCLREL